MERVLAYSAFLMDSCVEPVVDEMLAWPSTGYLPEPGNQMSPIACTVMLLVIMGVYL